jgi:hypothetical protein
MESGQGCVIVAFDGAVRCGRGNSAINLWLQGRTRIGACLSDANVFFSGATPNELPALLHDARLIELADGTPSPRRYRIESREMSLDLRARGVQLHRFAGEQLFSAVPQARVSWLVRSAWALLLSVLRLPGAAALLLGRRGRT